MDQKWVDLWGKCQEKRNSLSFLLLSSPLLLLLLVLVLLSGYLQLSFLSFLYDHLEWFHLQLDLLRWFPCSLLSLVSLPSLSDCFFFLFSALSLHSLSQLVCSSSFSLLSLSLDSFTEGLLCFFFHSLSLFFLRMFPPPLHSLLFILLSSQPSPSLQLELSVLALTESKL